MKNLLTILSLAAVLSACKKQEPILAQDYEMIELPPYEPVGEEGELRYRNIMSGSKSTKTRLKLDGKEYPASAIKIILDTSSVEYDVRIDTATKAWRYIELRAR